MDKILTLSDMIEGMKITNSMEQQRFFLSRFFKIPEDQLGNMAMDDIYPMMSELGNYFSTFDPVTKIEVIVKEEKIECRSQILDL